MNWAFFLFSYFIPLSVLFCQKSIEVRPTIGIEYTFYERVRTLGYKDSVSVNPTIGISLSKQLSNTISLENKIYYVKRNYVYFPGGQPGTSKDKYSNSYLSNNLVLNRKFISNFQIGVGISIQYSLSRRLLLLSSKPILGWQISLHGLLHSILLGHNRRSFH